MTARLGTLRRAAAGAAASAVALWLFGCGTRVRLGTTEGGGGEGAGGKGATDGKGGMDGKGGTGAGEIAPSDCALRSCGARCEVEMKPCEDPPCPPSVTNGFCDIQGVCQLFPTPCKGDCGGNVCGTPCSPCPDGDAGCTESGLIWTCDAFGLCNPSMAVDCVGSCISGICGEPCYVCDPGGDCRPQDAFACDLNTSCVPAELVRCALFPACKGMACGAPCWLCPPDDPLCVDPVCDAFGQCVLPEELFCP